MPQPTVNASPTYPDWSAYDGESPGGRDFLGLQSVGDFMLDILLPDLTNATRHPRYYAFFCWLFSQAHQRRLTVKQTDELRFRYETALVYSAKASHTQSVAGIVGILGVARGDKMWKGPEARYPLTKEDWGHRASAFSPAVYAPSFSRLGLIGRAPSGEIALLPAGQRLAEAYGRGIRNATAVAAVERRKIVDGDALVELHDDLCPCAVRSGTHPERQMLIDLLFRFDLESDERVRARRRSFAFILDLVEKADGDFPGTEDELRTLLYFRTFPAGRRYRPTGKLAQVADRWRLFQARQYQRYAIEALWAGYLRIVARMGIVPLRTRDFVRNLQELHLEELFARSASGRAVTTPHDVARQLQRAGAAAWVEVGADDEQSEAQWKARIDDALRDGDAESLLANAVGLIVTLWARWRTVDEVDAKVFLGAGGRARVSVTSMIQEVEARSEAPFGELLSWLLEEYAIAQHMRVATNKLRVEGLDTFWCVAEEGGYVMHPERESAQAKPGYNAPKLWAALSSLYDLRLVGRDTDGKYIATAEGSRMLQRILDAEA